MVKFILLIGLTTLVGCTSLPDSKMKNDPEFAPVEPTEPGVDVIIQVQCFKRLMLIIFIQI